LATAHAAIGHERFLEMAISKSYSGAPKGFRAEFSTTEVRPEQLGFFKPNAFQPGSLESRLRKIISDKPDVADFCIAQVDSTDCLPLRVLPSGMSVSSKWHFGLV
jgi:hypothetical protein